jgi:hypothetical protein
MLAMDFNLRRWWPAGLALVLVLGALLRVVWVHDMEYKYDECWTYWQTQGRFAESDSPWLGLYTSNGVRNPGMSVWVFLGLGKLFDVNEPTELARAVQVTNIIALLLLTWFALRVVRREEREAWLWAIALAAVNPLAVVFQRKIWPPSVFPLFTASMLVGWWFRERRGGAFLWGLIAAVVGQIHPSGFFFAAAFFLWAILFDRRRVAWSGWLAGSVLGVLPMLPWLHHVFTNRPTQPTPHVSWHHIFECKFWVRWVTESAGLGLDYSLFKDFQKFLCYPLVGDQPTYLVGLVHAVVVAILAMALFRTAHSLWCECGWRVRDWWARYIGRSCESAFTLNAAFWGFGLLLTLPCLPLYRHYMIILYPLECLWLVRLVLSPTPSAGRRAMLGGLIAAQLFITTNFLIYIHQTGGSKSGDYGLVYRECDELRSVPADNFRKPKMTLPTPPPSISASVLAPSAN